VTGVDGNTDWSLLINGHYQIIGISSFGVVKLTQLGSTSTLISQAISVLKEKYTKMYIHIYFHNTRECTNLRYVYI